MDEIGAWWRPDVLFQTTPRTPGRLTFEPGPQGRLVELLEDGGVFEIGRILDWSPPRRLAFAWRQASFPPDLATEVRVAFDPVGAETRVTVEHHGFTAVPTDSAARHGFPDAALQMRLGEWWRRLLEAYRQAAVA